MWVAVLTSLAATMPAQDVATIHVSTDRVQIPVLVLGAHREDLQPVPAEQFRVLLDGHEFAATIRRENDDPLEVTILVDTSDAKNALLPLLKDAVNTLGAAALKPIDHVSVYGMDGCKLRRSRTMDRADVHAIADAVEQVARIPSATRSPCTGSVGLWDALWYLTQSMRGLTGRRILLPISNGDDHGSKQTPFAVWQTAIQYGVSLFPLAERGHVAGASRAANNEMIAVMKANSLLSVSELSGGVVTEAIPPNLDFSLARIFRMVRSRYILEFPRPNGMFGHHALDVSLRTMQAMVRTGGLEFPARRDPSSMDVDTAALPALELPPAAPPAMPSTEPEPSPEATPTTTPTKPVVAAVQEKPPAPVEVIDITDITNDLKPH